MTWNEYIDEIVSCLFVRCTGICEANSVVARYYNDYFNYKILDKYLVQYSYDNHIPIYKYYWPIEDRQSRILFLKSLKEAE